jgi:uncharacterized protein YjiK
MARYALVAGIAKYSNSSLPDLSKTATDAAAVAEVLKQHGSYRVTLLNGEVKAKQLADALKTLLREQAVKNEALIYFTGHGIRGVTGVDILEQPQGFLAASDCNVTKAGEQWIVRDGVISLNNLNQLIQQSDLSNLVVIFDSCHSGEFLERGLVENALTVFRSQQDYYLITACRRFEQSWAKKSEQHSVFTGAFLAGLSQERAGDNGQVTVDRLFDYIANELRDSRQEPIRMGVGRSLTLVQYQPKKTEIVVDETCPYQGLEAFGKEQARFFFGREKVVQLLMEKLGQANFVPIIGASGSGKSSVVRAGLIPQLEKNGWRVLEPILPGVEPLGELKRTLTQLFGLRTDTKLAKDIRQRQRKSKLLAIAGDKLASRQTISKILEKLVDERLLIAEHEGDDWVDLTHEALIKGWKRYSDWLQENRELRQLRNRLEDSLEEWQKEKKNDNLMSRELLVQVQERWSELELNLPLPEKDFYRLSYVHQQEETANLLRGTEAFVQEQASKLLARLPSESVSDLVQVIQLTSLSFEKLQGKVPDLVQLCLQRAVGKNILKGHNSYVNSVTFSPDGRLIVIGCWDSTVKLWDIEGNPIGQPFRGHEGFVSSVAFSPNGQLIVSSGRDSTVRLWDIEGNPIGQPFRGHEGLVSSVAFSPDGRVIVSGGGDSTVRLWNIDGKPISRFFRGHNNFVSSVAFSPDGQLIVVGRINHTVMLLNLQGNLIGQPFWRYGGSVNSVAFSPDGQMIVSGSSDTTVQLSDIRGNPIGQPFRGHKGSVSSVAFSPDGQMIVSGSSDTTVRLWDIQGNSISPPLQEHEGYVRSVAFSPDGQMIVSGSSDTTVRMWRIGWRGWLQVCCDRLRYHPVFKNPQTEVEKQACETCRKYVWDK